MFALSIELAYFFLSSVFAIGENGAQAWGAVADRGHLSENEAFYTQLLAIKSESLIRRRDPDLLLA